jgi:hypothetical protein
MKAFICVYRQPIVGPKIRQQVEIAAMNQPLLQTFLNRYGQPDCFYDWGDDPAFFAATELFGDPCYASWGVCRPNVRRQLTTGDLVIFFCGRQSPSSAGLWEYFYLGYGTVREAMERRRIWEDEVYHVYRSFFNLLVNYPDGVETHYEPFGEPHADWQKRSQSPYVIFESGRQWTCFNTIDPLKVANYDSREGSFETWLADPLVKSLQARLFFNGRVDRNLRTKSRYRPHNHIALHRYFRPLDVEPALLALRGQLADLLVGNNNRFQ